MDYRITCKERHEDVGAYYGNVEADDAEDAIRRVFDNPMRFNVADMVEVTAAPDFDGVNQHVVAFRCDDGWEFHKYDTDGNGEVIKL